jgi:hypothetical protein
VDRNGGGLRCQSCKVVRSGWAYGFRAQLLAAE